MKYGKIRIEDGNFIFSKHMMMNYLPCKDIIWAYKRKEGVEGGAQKQYSTSSLVIITRRKKRYQFEMTDREIQNCIQLMRALNPQMVTGFPQGSRIPCKVFRIPEILCIRNRGWQTYSPNAFFVAEVCYIYLLRIKIC